MTSDLIVALTYVSCLIILRKKFMREVVWGGEIVRKVNALDMKSWKLGLDSL